MSIFGRTRNKVIAALVLAAAAAGAHETLKSQPSPAPVMEKAAIAAEYHKLEQAVPAVLWEGHITYNDLPVLRGLLTSVRMASDHGAAVDGRMTAMQEGLDKIDQSLSLIARMTKRLAGLKKPVEYAHWAATLDIALTRLDQATQELYENTTVRPSYAADDLRAVQTQLFALSIQYEGSVYTDTVKEIHNRVMNHLAAYIQVNAE